MYDVPNIADKGRVIALWSPAHRQGAVSANTALLASYLAETVEDGMKVLVMSNELYGAHTAAHYITDESMTDGLTEVCELSESDNLKNPQSLYDNTFSFGPKLDIINSSKRNTNIRDNLPRQINNIFNVARQGYRYTLVDTVSGVYDNSSQEILRRADVIIICMPQDKFTFESFIKKVKGFYPDAIKDDKRKRILIVSSIHYEYEHMTYNSMRKALNKRYPLSHIQMNDVIHKAVGDRNIYNAVRSELKSKKPDVFISELEDITYYVNMIIANIAAEETAMAEREEELARQNTEKYLQEAEVADSLFDDYMYDSDGDENTSDYDESQEDISRDAEFKENIPDESNKSAYGFTNEPLDNSTEQGLSEENPDDLYSGDYN